MKKRKTWIIIICIAAVLIAAAVIALAVTRARTPKTPVSQANAANFGALLTDLVNAAETPGAGDEETIRADLAAIRAVSKKDHAIAASIAEHWQSVYLDPDYRLFLYHGGGSAPELAEAGIPDSPTHAIVVLGYELEDGQMQPELVGRCETAAAAARAFPHTILVCSGGATGPNNPDGNTEAGLMKAYLTERCGIDEARIFIDEDAMTTQENAVNTFRILQENKVRTMTIVTSTYHQLWGQAVYHTVAELYRQQHGYPVEIVGNYCYDTEPTVEMYRHGARIAAFQIAGILELPEDVIRALPSFFPTAAERAA